MILESSADWKAAVRSAASIDDIFDVFSGLFGGPGGLDFKQMSHRSDGLKKALDVFRTTSDPEARYDASTELSRLNGSVAAKLAGLTEKEIWEATAGRGNLLKEASEALVERNTTAGKALVGSVVSDQDVAAYQTTCDQLKEMTAMRTAEIETVMQKFREKQARAEEEYGIRTLLAKKYDGSMLSKFDSEQAERRKRRPPESDTEALAQWLAEYREAQVEFTKSMDRLDAEIYALNKIRIFPIQDKCADKINELNSEYEVGIHGLREDKVRFENRLWKGVLTAVLDQSPVSQEDAEGWAAKNVTIEKQALVRLRKQSKNYQNEAALKADIKEFYRLTGGRLGPVIIRTKGQRRANADSGAGVVNIDNRFGKRTLFHEMAHLLERNQKMLGMSVIYRDGKADKSKGKKRLSKITGNKAYRSDEVAYTDGFFDPYVGKVYPGDRYTEVMSMGMQMFSSAEAMTDLRMKEPELFNLMTGFMLSRPTETDKQHTDEFAEVTAKIMGDKAALESFHKKLEKKVNNSGEFWKGSKLVDEIAQTASTRAAGRWKVYVRFGYPGQPVNDNMSWYKDIKSARIFAYLYLHYVQKGIITSQSVGTPIVWNLERCIPKKESLPLVNTENLPEFLEDLKGF